MSYAAAAALVVCAFTTAIGCGTTHGDDGGGDDGADAAATLSVSPPDTMLTLAPAVPAMATYTATATYPDGHTRDVTTETAFSIDGQIGSFATNQLTVGAAGKAQVTASWDPSGDPSATKHATATVIATMKSSRVDPSLPANIGDLFAQATEDPTTAPQIVYPEPNVVVPRNLGDFESHWIDGHGHDVFELSLHTEFSDVRVYVPGSNALPDGNYAGPDPTWAAFLADEWVAAVGSESSINYQVRGLTLASPTTVGSTAPQLVRLSNETMLGGLYYWGIYTTTQVSGVWRHDMEQPGAPAEQFISTATTPGGHCVACHALSRDGAHMAISYDGGNSTSTLVDVGTKVPQGIPNPAQDPTGTLPQATNRWNFATFTPDGSELITVEGGRLTLRSSVDQSAIVDPVPTGAITHPTHPDISADGKNLVFAAPPDGQFGADYSFGQGAIYTMTFDQATHTFGAPVKLVDSSTTYNYYYPTWSPDGKWILFNRSTDQDPTPNGGTYNDADATLWVIKADGSGPAIALTTANQSGALANSWGRWAPFGQTLGENGEPMFWITTSSVRTFGVRRQQQGWPSIWMFGFLSNKADQNGDPSTPAFRLPFQDFASHNHIAQWAEKVVITQ